MPLINNKLTEVTIYPAKTASSLSVYFRWVKFCNYLNRKYGYRLISDAVVLRRDIVRLSKEEGVN